MQNWVKCNKIQSGYLTPAFSGAQKRAEMLRHPCILGDPQTKGDKTRIGYLTPAFSGAKKSGNATSPLHSRGSPTTGTKSDLKTYARGNNDAPRISKYGSLVRADAQLAALR